MKAAASEDLLREHLSSGRFQRFLGIELVSTDTEAREIVPRLPWSEDFERLPDSRRIHGGIAAAPIDIAGANADAKPIAVGRGCYSTPRV